MTSYSKCLIAAVLALAAVGVLMVSIAGGQVKASVPALGRCFPAAKWGPAPDAVRPCVEVTQVYEDGSFSYAVRDADGVVRYTAGVGALDR